MEDIDDNGKSLFEKGYSIRKYCVDENGGWHEETVEVTPPDPLLYAKVLTGVCKLLGLRIEELKSVSKSLTNPDADCYCNSKNGKKIIVEKGASFGKYLVAGANISFEKLFEDFKSGIRNGDFNTEELEKDASILEISLIKSVGIPMRRRITTMLLVSNDIVTKDDYSFSIVDYVIVDNNRFSITRETRQKIDEIIKNNYEEIKKISEEQTPEFFEQHTSYDDMSIMFNLKDTTREMNISCHTHTPSDEFLRKIVEDIKLLVCDNGDSIK